MLRSGYFIFLFGWLQIHKSCLDKLYKYHIEAYIFNAIEAENMGKANREAQTDMEIQENIALQNQSYFSLMR